VGVAAGVLAAEVAEALGEAEAVSGRTESDAAADFLAWVFSGAAALSATGTEAAALESVVD
jgi:hypothetical protein